MKSKINARSIKALSFSVHLRWMTLMKLRKERDFMKYHPCDFFSLTGETHTLVIEIKKESRSNPKEPTLRSNPQSKS
jgi:hypothetical protein